MLEVRQLKIQKQLMIADMPDLDEALKSLYGSAFICLIAADNPVKTFRDEFESLITRLLVVGCKYFLAYGENCEETHDFIDATVLKSVSSEKNSECILTTWHEDEVPEDVVHHLVYASLTDKSPEADRNLLVLIHPAFRKKEQLRQALYQPTLV